LGIFCKENVGFGFRRLSIIDLSPAGNQPMSDNEKKIWIAFNGEIYNFISLREELERDGVQFKSKTDTEVIIYLYKKYGVDCLKKLRGMFAFAIWDYFFIAKNGFSFGIQGRYFFPMVTFHLTILFIGFLQIAQIIFQKYSSHTAIVLIVLMMALNWLSLIFVSFSYYDFSDVATFIKQASQYKPLIFKGDIILVMLLANLISQCLFLFTLLKSRNIISK
jgi:hypothetical protein